MNGTVVMDAGETSTLFGRFHANSKQWSDDMDTNLHYYCDLERFQYR